MLTIEESIRAGLEKTLISEAVRVHVDKQIEDCVKNSLAKAFDRYNSPIAKAIEEKIQTSLATAIDIDDLSQFGHIVHEMIKRRLANLADERAFKLLDDLFGQLLGDHRAVITLDGLVEMAEEKFREEANRKSGVYLEESFTVLIEESKGQDGWWDLSIDPGYDKERYSCAFNLRFQPDNVTGQSKCWYVSRSGVKYEEKLFNGPLYGFDAAVFHLYTGMSTLQRTRSYSTQYKRDECHCD